MRQKQILTDSRSTRRKRGSTLVLFTLMMPSLLIPLMGLGIDATMLYIVQAKLSAATDGAALGAGRLLGTLADPAEIAGEFLHVNFPTNNQAGFWGAYNLVPTITYVAGITKTITVNATARVPLLFSRVFGQNNALISAVAIATRSDSRVVLVIDRSGSMLNDDGTGTGATVIEDAKEFASGFVQKFTPGTDELGLVVFDGSGVVGYPTGAWTPDISLASTGGPNKQFNDGTTNDLPHQIARINANGATGMGEAMSLAYIELQKAHMRDLAADGVDTRLNSIVLLSDGVPTGVTLLLNSASDNAIKTTSSCTYKATPATKMIGWLGIPGDPVFTANSINGMRQPASTDPTAGRNAVWWMSNGGSDVTDPNPATPFAGCTGLKNSQDQLGNSTTTDLTKIPDKDYYGNALNTTGYTNSHITGGAAISIYNGTPLSQAQKTSDYHWSLAVWNSIDNAAKNARNDANLGNRTGDTSGNMNIAIYAIGYTGNGGCDDGLLKRLANDKGAAGYDSSQKTGMYVQASNKAALAAAFNTVASALLRLAR